MQWVKIKGSNSRHAKSGLLIKSNTLEILEIADVNSTVVNASKSES